jgi:hypothetical protein
MYHTKRAQIMIDRSDLFEAIFSVDTKPSHKSQTNNKQQQGREENTTIQHNTTINHES